MNRKKTFFIVLVIAVVVVGVIFALVTQKEKEMNPEEFLERFENAAEEVLGEDIQQVSKTELVATLTYGHETDKDNNIYNRNLLHILPLLSALNCCYINGFTDS